MVPTAGAAAIMPALSVEEAMAQFFRKFWPRPGTWKMRGCADRPQPTSVSAGTLHQCFVRQKGAVDRCAGSNRCDAWKCSAVKTAQSQTILISTPQDKFDVSEQLGLISLDCNRLFDAPDCTCMAKHSVSHTPLALLSCRHLTGVTQLPLAEGAVHAHRNSPCCLRR